VIRIMQARRPARCPRRTLPVSVLAGAIPFAVLAVSSALADGGTGGFSQTGAPGGAGGTGFAAPGNDGSNGGNDCSFGFSAGGGGGGGTAGGGGGGHGGGWCLLHVSGREGR
jgi:hypothetical protein